MPGINTITKFTLIAHFQVSVNSYDEERLIIIIIFTSRVWGSVSACRPRSSEDRGLAEACTAVEASSSCNDHVIDVNNNDDDDDLESTARPILSKLVPEPD